MSVSATNDEGTPVLRARLLDRWWGRLGLRLGALAAFLLLWQWAGDDSLPLLFPTFTRTLASGWDMIVDGRLPAALFVTNQTLIVGFGLAVAVGVPAGVVIAGVRLVDRIVTPYLTLLVAIPIIALIPVIQALLGLSFSARVAVVVLFAIPYIVINTAVAVRRVDPALVEMATSYGGGRRTVLLDVILPAAVPGIMTGVRIALGQALIGMVVAELTIVGDGVGSLIAELQGRFRVAPVLAVAVAVVLEGIVLMSLVEWIERRLSRWSVS